MEKRNAGGLGTWISNSLASKVLENVPGQNEHKKHVKSEVSVKVFPNPLPFVPQKRRDHGMFQ